MNSVSHKQCAKCGEVKSINDFGLDNRRQDGHFPYCKKCRWRNPFVREEAIKMQEQGLRKCSTCKLWLPVSDFGSNRAHKDGLHNHCKKCAREQVDRYTRENKEKVKARDKAYRDANPEKRSFFWQRWARANEDKVILKSHANRANRSSQPDTLTGTEWREIIGKQGNRCAKCRRLFTKELPPTRDHVVPLSKGGLLTKENCQALCRSCNTSKGTKIVDYR